MKPNIEKFQHKKELSPAEKEILENLHKIPIVDYQKKNLILVWRKLKRGSDFSVKGDVDEKEVLEILKKAGLFAKFVPTRVSGYKDCYFAQSEEDVDTLIRLDDEHDQTDAMIQLGKVYSFPDTSIAGYISSDGEGKEGFMLSLKEESEKIPAELKPFLAFRLSKDHWREEMEIGKKWAEEIKFVDPELYRRIIDKSQNMVRAH
ncbi:MAG: hypothetical protein KBC06_01330 [Candidatus Pacebacteria bacterium]|nr:hypothetical protein [Candidatus Paceibacterota bacterium]